VTSTSTVTAELDPTTSWRDWMPEDAPDPPLLSHDELIQELRNRGVEVTAATLEHWRRNGVVPRPVRRHHNGKTRPTYPSWIVPAVAHLRQLQESGRTLEEIAPVMRAWAHSSVAWDDPLAGVLAEARAALINLAAATQPDAVTITVTMTNAAGDPLHSHEVRIPPKSLS
jgi:DNA-binding transcriptional MerR regulator